MLYLYRSFTTTTNNHLLTTNTKLHYIIWSAILLCVAITSVASQNTSPPPPPPWDPCYLSQAQLLEFIASHPESASNITGILEDDHNEKNQIMMEDISFLQPCEITPQGSIANNQKAYTIVTDKTMIMQALNATGMYGYMALFQMISNITKDDACQRDQSSYGMQFVCSMLKIFPSLLSSTSILPTVGTNVDMKNDTLVNAWLRISNVHKQRELMVQQSNTSSSDNSTSTTGFSFFYNMTDMNVNGGSNNDEGASLSDIFPYTADAFANGYDRIQKFVSYILPFRSKFEYKPSSSIIRADSFSNSDVGLHDRTIRYNAAEYDPATNSKKPNTNTTNTFIDIGNPLHTLWIFGQRVKERWNDFTTEKALRYIQSDQFADVTEHIRTHPGWDAVKMNYNIARRIINGIHDPLTDFVTLVWHDLPFAIRYYSSMHDHYNDIFETFEHRLYDHKKLKMSSAMKGETGGGHINNYDHNTITPLGSTLTQLSSADQIKIYFYLINNFDFRDTLIHRHLMETQRLATLSRENKKRLITTHSHTTVDDTSSTITTTLHAFDVTRQSTVKQQYPQQQIPIQKISDSANSVKNDHSVESHMQIIAFSGTAEQDKTTPNSYGILLSDQWNGFGDPNRTFYIFSTDSIVLVKCAACYLGSAIPYININCCNETGCNRGFGYLLDTTRPQCQYPNIQLIPPGYRFLFTKYDPSNPGCSRYSSASTYFIALVWLFTSIFFGALATIAPGITAYPFTILYHKLNSGLPPNQYVCLLEHSRYAVMYLAIFIAVLVFLLVWFTMCITCNSYCASRHKSQLKKLKQSIKQYNQTMGKNNSPYIQASIGTEYTGTEPNWIQSMNQYTIDTVRLTSELADSLESFIKNLGIVIFGPNGTYTITHYQDHHHQQPIVFQSMSYQ